MNGSMPRDPWSLVIFSDFTSTEIEAYKLPEPLIVPEVQTSDALTAYELVLADAGASFPIRDEVDARIINDVNDGTGGIIDDEEQVGGWPVLDSAEPPADIDGDGMPDEWEIANCLSPYNPDDAATDRDGDGYTNIEEYINWLPLEISLPPETELNCDGIVNFLDFSDFALHYLKTYRHQWYYDRYDFNNDREFSMADLSLIARDWLSVF
jgi:hypothetical protein